MRKFLLFALLAALAIPALAQTPKSATFNFKYDVDSDSLAYCVLGGQNGDPFGSPIAVANKIKTTGASATVTASTPPTSPGTQAYVSVTGAPAFHIIEVSVTTPVPSVYTGVAVVANPGEYLIVAGDADATAAHIVCAIADAGCTEGPGQDFMATAPNPYFTGSVGPAAAEFGLTAIANGNNTWPATITLTGPIPLAGSFGNGTDPTYSADGTPFRGLAAGDVLVIANQVGPAPANQTYSFRTIVTATSVASVDVDSAITLTGSGGHTFGYYKLTCGTAVTSGWVNVAGASTAAMTVQYEQGDLATGLRARFECISGAIGALPVIVYPGETSDCGLGGTLTTDKCQFATASELTRLTVAVDGAIFDRCRVGFEREGADASDAGAALEQFTATITVVK